jgi:hypothetical protein
MSRSGEMPQLPKYEGPSEGTSSSVIPSDPPSPPQPLSPTGSDSSGDTIKASPSPSTST